jgi:uncharacterized membrane protein YphA (DoxX/SURF4 family)
MTTPIRLSTQTPSIGVVYWLCLLLLCSAYLQGAIEKALDFQSALAEMRNFGLASEAPIALLTIIGEIFASLLILSGYWRWAGAAFLGLFTLMATGVANRFWELQGGARMMSENGFFEHLGLAGAFVLVAWIDFHSKPRATA